jgi:protein-tyrosine phosphatase
MVDIDTLQLRESYWIIPGRLRAGEYPGARSVDEARRRLRWLLDGGTNFIIDLTVENESGLRPYHDVLYEEAQVYSYVGMYKRFPLQDFNTPAKEQVVEVLDMIDLALSLGKNIYLHCHGGKGRTGTIVGCYLVRQGLAGNEALERIKELRKDIPNRDEQSPETEGQRRMVLEWKIGQ